MNLKEAPDKSEWGITHILESEHAYMGVYRVAYGWRVRAGLLSDHYGCTLDWCCGAEWYVVRTLYSALAAILTARPDNEHCFDGLPPHSNIKPYYKDEEFIREVLAAMPGTPVHYYKLEQP